MAYLETSSSGKLVRVVDEYGYDPRSGSYSNYSQTIIQSIQMLSKKKTWVRTPNFNVLKKNGSVLPDNSFILDTFSLFGQGGSVETPSRPKAYPVGATSGLRVKYLGPAGAGVNSYPGLPDFSLVNSKLIKKAQGNQWNVPIFLAEGRKTASMVATAATRIVQMANALRRGRFGDFAKYAHPSAALRLQDGELRKKFGRHYARDPKRAPGAYWLELRYGWLPFMSDVKSAVDTLMDTAERPNSLEGSVRASYKFPTKIDTKKNLLIWSDSSYAVRVLGTSEVTLELSLRATWRFTTRAGDIPGRFGLLNPLLVAWELVPFSFVWDWFSPVGSYLSALDTPFRFTHIGGTRGYRAITTTKIVGTSLESPNGRSFTGFGGDGIHTIVVRQPLTALPEVKLSSLAFDLDMTATRMTSAMALLQQVFSGRKRL